MMNKKRILMTGKEGLADFEEEFSLGDQFQVTVKNSSFSENYVREQLDGASQLRIKSKHSIGNSDVLRNLLDRAAKAAKTSASVLIYGESGTGKELIAGSIHNQSSRVSHAFIAVDCVALPETLLESGLFGYQKGAFTGAQTTRRGLLEYAHGGTLFLDEICELGTNLQAKLLRVLQEKEFRRVGGKDLIKVDLRIIAATNRKPEEAIETGLLREDLYYRLSVIPLEIPPLRARKEDIPVLVEHYIQEFCHLNQIRKKEITVEALEGLIAYSWPGNVRELMNLVERLVTMVDDDRIELVHLPENIVNRKSKPVHRDNGEILKLPFTEAKRQIEDDFEKDYFVHLLQSCKGNISKAAHIARISRPTIYRVIKDHKLDYLI